MKNIILILILLSSFLEAKTLALIHYDPFKKAQVLLKLKVNKRTPIIHRRRRRRLRVDAILNNRVYINGKFYGVGRVIYGYKILTIADNYIKVKKNRKILKISLIKSNYFDTIENIKN